MSFQRVADISGQLYCPGQTLVHMPQTLEVAQRQFQPSKFGMVIVIEGESDIQSVAGKQFCLLDAFGHAPPESTVCDRFLPPLAGTLGVDARQDS